MPEELEHFTDYCAVVRAQSDAVNATSGLKLVSDAQRSNGIRACIHPPTAGVVATVPISELADDESSDSSLRYPLWATNGAVSPPTLVGDLDVDFVNSTRVLARWAGFTDACAWGIQIYSVALELRREATADGLATESWQLVENITLDVMHRNRPGHQVVMNASADGFYRVTVCATSLTKLSACASSDGFTKDTTPPDAGDLCIGIGPTAKCASQAALVYVPPTLDAAEFRPLRAAWSRFTDEQSGVESFRLAIGSSDGLDDVDGWRYLGWATGATLPDLRNRTSWPAYLTVVCRNGAGGETRASLAFVVDATPPAFADGALRSIAAQTPTFVVDASALTVQWDASYVTDPESPMSNFTLVVLGADLTPLHSEPLSLTAQGPQTFTYAAGAPFHEYIFYLHATNAAGLSSQSESLSLYLDPNPPSITATLTVCDELYRPRWAQGHINSLQLCVKGTIPSTSGVSTHAVTVKDASANVLLSTQVSHRTWPDSSAYAPFPEHELAAGEPTQVLRIQNLSLPCGARLAIEAIPISGAGQAAVGSAFTQAAVQIDCTPPAINASLIDIQVQNAPTGTGWLGYEPVCVPLGTEEVVMAWSGVSDGETGVAAFHIQTVSTTTTVTGNTTTSSVSLGAKRAIGLQQRVGVNVSSLVAEDAHVLKLIACNGALWCATADSLPLYFMGPPGAGTATLLTPSGTPGFLGSATAHVLAAWSGFSNVAPTERLEYEVCVGTTQFGCQLRPFTEASTSTSWQFDSPRLRCGETYYVAVRATNCAGMQQTSTSPGVKVCCDAPADGIVAVTDDSGEAVTYLTDQASATISWAGLVEPCAGVRDYVVQVHRVLDGGAEQLVWASGNITNITSAAQQRVTLGKDVIGALPAEATLLARVTATSFAGHARVSTSPMIFVDRLSPQVKAPTFTYVKPTGLIPNPPTDPVFTAACIPPDVPHVSLHMDVRDDGSGLTTTKLASTVLANASLDDAALAWQEVGALREIHVNATLLARQGETFYALRACDRVGQCAYSNWSLGVNVLGRGPTGGRVFFEDIVGGKYLSSPDALRPAWTGFSASGCPERCDGVTKCFYDWTCADTPPRNGGLGCNAGGLSKMCRFCGSPGLSDCPDTVQPSDIGGLIYEVCIGTTPDGCQVKPLTHVASVTNWQVPQPDLRCGATYYAAVRATNCAGMQRTRMSEGGIKVCCDPPTKGTVSVTNAFGETVRYLTDQVSGASNLTIGWEGFVEPCSGVKEYSVHVVRLAEDGTEAQTMWNSTGLSNAVQRVTLDEADLAALPSDMTYLAKVTATSNADHARVSTALFTVDRAPPSVSNITLRWAGSVVAHSGSGPTCVPTTVDKLEISWAAAHDIGSTVVNNSLGFDNTTGGGDGARAYEWVSTQAFKKSTRSAAFMRTADGSSYQPVTLASRSCDQAGMCTISSTHEVFPVQYPPSGGDVLLRASAVAAAVAPVQASPVVPDGVGLLNSTDTPIRVDWANFTRSLITDSLEYEVCVGTTPFGCQLWPFAPVGTANAWSEEHPQMRCGTTYHAAVRATDCAGLQHTSASAGVKVCCDPPADGVVTVVDADGETVTYLTDDVSATVSWAGFVEPCSGIRDYVVQLLRTQDRAVVWQSELITNVSTSSVNLSQSDLSSLPLGNLLARVVASSYAEHVGSSTEFAFVVDRTPPLLGTVYDSLGFTDVFCLHAEQPLEVSWDGFSDPVSGVATVQWALGTQAGGSDVMPFRPVEGKARGYASIEPSALNVSLDVGSTLFSTIRVRNRAGLETSGVSSGVAIVRRDCDTSAICTPLRSQVSAGVHPMFASLLYGFVGVGSSQLTYDIAGRALTPQEGEIRLEAVVHMQKEGEHADGARLMSLRVQEVRTIDRYGAAHAVDEFIGVHHTPAFYWQSANGTILEILYHETETNKSIQVKKQMISQHQLVSPSTSYQAHQAGRRGLKDDDSDDHWTTEESDADGNSYNFYTRRRHLLDFGRKDIKYTKKQVWGQDEVKRSGVSQETRVSIFLSSRSMELKRLVHRVEIKPDELPEGLLKDKHHYKERGLETRARLPFEGLGTRCPLACLPACLLACLPACLPA